MSINKDGTLEFQMKNAEGPRENSGNGGGHNSIRSWDIKMVESTGLSEMWQVPWSKESRVIPRFR